MTNYLAIGISTVDGAFCVSRPFEADDLANDNELRGLALSCLNDDAVNPERVLIVDASNCIPTVIDYFDVCFDVCFDEDNPDGADDPGYAENTPE